MAEMKAASLAEEMVDMLAPSWAEEIRMGCLSADAMAA